MREDRFMAAMRDMYYYINLMYITPDVYTRNTILALMKSKLNELGHIYNECCNNNAELINSNNNNATSNEKVFTITELAKYNGKNGNPAYVAVNNVVYDVTNNAQWAAATHFGLTAGKDLTEEFTSCHGSQQILNSLEVVGRLL